MNTNNQNNLENLNISYEDYSSKIKAGTVILNILERDDGSIVFNWKDTPFDIIVPIDHILTIVNKTENSFLIKSKDSETVITLAGNTSTSHDLIAGEYSYELKDDSSVKGSIKFQ